MKAKSFNAVRVLTALLLASFVFPFMAKAEQKVDKDVRKRIEHELQIRLGVRDPATGKNVEYKDKAVFVLQHPGLSARFTRPSLIQLLSNASSVFNVIANGALTQASANPDRVLDTGEEVIIHDVTVGNALEYFYLEVGLARLIPITSPSGEVVNQDARAYVLFQVPTEWFQQEKYDPMTQEVFRWMTAQAPWRLPHLCRGVWFKTFSHSDFMVSYPADWRVQGTEFSAVAIAPKGAISKKALQNGLILNTFRPPAESSVGKDELIQRLIDDVRRQNPHLEVKAEEPAQVAGSTVKTFQLAGSYGPGKSEKVWLVPVSRPDGSLLYLLFIAQEKDQPEFRPTFQDMLASLQLTETSKSQASTDNTAPPQPAGNGQPSQASNKIEIQPGMTDAEVRKVLGAPLKEISFGNKTTLKYSDVTIELVNGKVTELRVN